VWHSADNAASCIEFGTAQWEKIAAEKLGPCRVCGSEGRNGRLYGLIHLHRLVSRQDGGDDVPDNIVPLCPSDHARVTQRDAGTALVLMLALSDAEYGYMVERGGEDYLERAYGLVYRR
jgi:HNH endonuclease